MRKQKIYTIIGMLALLLLSACSLHEEEDFFGDSSANRMSEALKNYKEILTAPENGWIMQYYPGDNQAYGGYNVLVAFNEDGKVTVSSELSEVDASVTSLYSLKQSAGPVLSFDSYNEIMHLFSEPLGGWGGDFQFTIMSATADKVVLSGTKTRNMVTLIPMAKEQTWADYLKDVAQVQKSIFLGTFHFMVNGKEIGTVEQNDNVFTLTYMQESEYKTEAVPFVYTAEGIQLYDPITINGTTISTFKADVENVSFICTDAGVDAKLEAFYPQGYCFYDQLVGTYTMGNTTVKVAANPDGKTYTLSGFATFAGHNYGTVQAEYIRSMGTLSITTQYLGMAYGYYAYLCPVSATSVTWLEGAGLVGVNSAASPLTITFKDNGAWGEADSFMIYAFSGQPASGANILGWLEEYPTPIVLVKQN